MKVATDLPPTNLPPWTTGAGLPLPTGTVSQLRGWRVESTAMI
jgi:hypothetical protein